MQASGNVPVVFGAVESGPRGTDQTVALMAKMAMGQYGARSPKIRALALNVISQAGIIGKDYQGEARAIYEWVRDRIRYVRDVAGQETLSYPEEVAFNAKQADCDDKSMLLAALLASVGFRTRFKVMGETRGGYSHVYMQAVVGNQWVTMDPIMAQSLTSPARPMGWEVPASRRVIEKVYPENTLEGTSMRGLGYVGDPRVVSHLEPDPVAQPPAGAYVIMPSLLDNDNDINSISNQTAAFHPQANVPDHLQPGYREAVAAQAAQDQRMGALGAVQAAMLPGLGLHGVWTPDQLAAIPARTQPEIPQAHMNRPALVQDGSQGVDAMFTRQNLVMRDDRGQVQYYGVPSKAERPAIRPWTGFSGADGQLPGMGRLTQLSGPGLSDDAPSATQAAAPPPAGVPPLVKLLAAAVLVWGATKLIKPSKGR